MLFLLRVNYHTSIQPHINRSTLMATYKTHAIILSSFPYKEHDRIITFFSEDYGRIDARARGSRKITSKLAGHLEQFIETELLLANGRRWDILAGSRTIEPFFMIRTDLYKTAAAAVCVEATKIVTKPLNREYMIYALLRKTLEQIEQSQTPNQDVVYRFLWQLLGRAGFAPEIERCIVSKAPVTTTGYFSFEGGGILAQVYRERDSNALEIDMRDFVALPNTQEPLSQTMRTLISTFWQRVIDHTDLRSWTFFMNTYGNF